MKSCNQIFMTLSVFTNYFSQVRTKTSDAYYINNDFTSVIKV